MSGSLRIPCFPSESLATAESVPGQGSRLANRSSERRGDIVLAIREQLSSCMLA